MPRDPKAPPGLVPVQKEVSGHDGVAGPVVLAGKKGLADGKYMRHGLAIHSVGVMETAKGFQAREEDRGQRDEHRAEDKGQARPGRVGPSPRASRCQSDHNTNRQKDQAGFGRAKAAPHNEVERQQEQHRTKRTVEEKREQVGHCKVAIFQECGRQ